MNTPNVRLGQQGDPTRVTGSISGLAVSTHGLVSFDLGPEFDKYSLVAVFITPVGPMTTNVVNVYGADAAALTTADLIAGRKLGIPGAQVPSAQTATNMLPATGCQTLWVRPAGRFVTVDFLNSDATNAAGVGSTINFAAYAGA